MFRFFFIVLLSAGLYLFFASGVVMAAGPSKGLKVDPLLEQAIRATALSNSKMKEEIEEIEVKELSAKEPIIEDVATKIEAPLINKKIEKKPKKPRPIGLKYNGILFLPSFISKQGWIDNVFAADGKPEGDFMLSVTPHLRVEIPDIRHDIVLEGSYESRRYWKNSGEDQRNAKVTLDAHLRAERGLSVPFGFTWEQRNEEREDDLTHQNSSKPLGIEDFKIESGIQFKPGSFSVSLLGHYQTQRYEDGFAKTNKAPIIRHDADRDIMNLEFNTSFDLDSENTLMLWGRTGKRDYQQRSFQGGAFNGPQRNSKLFSGMTSWVFDYEGLKGHASFGVEDYNYEDAAIHNVRELVGDAELDHKLREKTSLNLQLARSIDEDDEVIQPIIHSRFGLYLNHQPWKDIMVAAGTDYDFLEFTNSIRSDETWNFKLVTDYFMNDRWAFGGEFAYTARNSNQKGLGFNRSIFLLRVRGRL